VSSNGDLAVVSVVIPARNCVAELPACLDAVSAAMDQEQAAAETALPEVQADRREAARLAGQK